MKRPYQNNCSLKIIAWNVNGARTKLENMNVYNFLSNFDIISLNESKTPFNISIPGYISFQSKPVTGAASLRGGTIVMVKNYLAPQVFNIDNSIIDQVWLQIRCAPDIMFGFCYVPPADSQYFSHQSFIALNGKMLDYKSDLKFCNIGDLNARFGASIRDIPLRSTLPDINNCTYPNIPDNVPSPNDNAYILSTICVDNDLVVLNNLKTLSSHFPGQKTFKKRNQWISEIDTAIMSFYLVNNICTFSVHQTDWLPSDHAPISIELNIPETNMDSLLLRANNLGGHGSLMGQSAHVQIMNRPISFSQIDLHCFTNTIQNSPMLDTDNSDVNIMACDISKSLYEYVNSSRTNATSTQISSNSDTTSVSSYLNRWERLLQDPDDARVWKALDWKGNFSDNLINNDSPSDSEFKQFYETHINQYNNESLECDTTNCINVPILDDLITPEEVTSHIEKLKANKSCGPDGIPPGVYKLLSPSWILTITTLFNSILSSATYPASWSRAKLFMLFKRGNRKDPNNYRGISVIDSIAKLFDMVLCSRLELWFKPDREQAGAQRGRGCTEHIVSLRLLTDYANKKKKKLFVTFVDFSKAYDLVPRHILFSVLKRLGCGAVMLSIIVAMYSVTQSIIGTAIITTVIGVRQGSPTSCFLFILYVNDLIKLLKETCEHDSFLSWLHLLVLMDDTVLLATNRNNITKKIKLLCNFCEKYGMIINESKTKLMVINGSGNDKEPITVNNLVITHCDIYTYLGSPFTSDGSISSAIKIHAKEKMAHFHKFIAFLDKNYELPFVIKKRVFDACLLSAMLYGCESWLNGDLKPVCKLYNWALKHMLGVRRTTCNDVCYLESGYAPLNAIVKTKQRKFFVNMYRDRMSVLDDPLGFVLKLVLDNRYSSRKYLFNLINDNTVNDCQNEIQVVKDKLMRSESTRRVLYRNTMNKDLTVNDIYTKNHSIIEAHRIAFTRFRVSSHSLAVETGRWNRRGRGRLPMEERLCDCGEVQTEIYVISQCPISQHKRDEYEFTSITDLMSERFSNEILCKIIYEILNLYA